MKAAVCREFNAPLVIEDVQLAVPGPGEIRVKTAACAICHSDISYADGAWGGNLPAVYGHEASGVVEEVGPGVRNIAVGDHVVVTLIRSCGSCHYCSRGEQVVCSTAFPLDRQSPLTNASGESYEHGLRTGGFAEQMVVDQSQAVVVSKDMPLDSASLLACGVITGFGSVVNTAGMEAGSNVVVIGTGGVGLNAVQGAALAGANRVIAVDISEDKLKAARAFGATDTINATANDASKQVKALTGGRRADYVFVTVGVKSAIQQAFSFLGRSGSIVLVGMPESGVMVDFDPGILAAIGQRIIGSKMGSSRIQVDIPMLVDLYNQKRLKLDELITGRYPLDQINDAIAGVKNGTALRNVIVF
ncbi:MAG: Zn-dependent alcohol dehydrogenase [Hyphomicrobiaceae bacterium]